MTVDYSELYSSISKAETLSEVQPLEGFLKTWEIEFSFCESNNEYSTSLLLCFKDSFPVTFPKVYLSNSFFSEIGWIPHLDIDSKKRPFICVFDENESEALPGSEIRIIQIALDKARREIRNGIAGKNHSDFINEFQAYWRRKDNDEPKLKGGFLFIGQPQSDFILEAFLAKEPVSNRYNYLVFTDTSESEHIKTNILQYSGVPYYKKKVFYIGEISSVKSPPYCINSKELFELIQKECSGVISSLKREYDAGSKDIYVFARIMSEGSRNMFIGWQLPMTDKNKSKMRWKYLIKREYKINRLIVDEYSNERLLLRTAGTVKTNKAVNRLCFAGLGSIGSHLLDYYKDFNFAQISLIDPETLTLENIKRHTLGIDSIGLYKVEALAKYLTNNIPETSIDIKNDDILDFLMQEKANNQYDLLVVAIGMEMVERQIRKFIYDRKLNIPVLFIWVEPYISAGHALYLPCLSKEDIETELCEKGLFTKNVIDRSEYLKSNELLFKNEAGCQGTYVPYSGNLVKQFIYGINSWLSTQIENPSKNACSITWIGNIDIIKNMGIKVAPEMVNKSRGELIEQYYGV
jgi:hypothetical protein